MRWILVKLKCFPFAPVICFEEAGHNIGFIVFSLLFLASGTWLLKINSNTPNDIRTCIPTHRFFQGLIRLITIDHRTR